MANVYGWSQLFKDESANHKRVKDSVYDSNRKVTLFGEGHSLQIGCSHTFAVVAIIKLPILAATIQIGLSYHPVSVTLCTVESGTAGHSIKKRDSPAKNGTVGRYVSIFVKASMTMYELHKAKKKQQHSD